MRTQFCEKIADLISGDPFAAVDLGKALVEVFGDGLLVAEPVILGVEEIEGVGDDLGWFAIAAKVDLPLDALFGFGVQGEIHR